MSCDLTPLLVAEYLAGDLSAAARQVYDEHLLGCAHCSAELSSLNVVHEDLMEWRPQPVPEWSRTSVATSTRLADLSFSRLSIEQERGATNERASRRRGLSVIRQWLPLAVSLVLAVAVVMQALAPRLPTAEAPLMRPELSGVQEVYALSLGAGTAAAPVTMSASEQLAAVERQVFSVLCDFAAELRALPPDQHLAVVLPAPELEAGQDAVPHRLYRLSGGDLQLCEEEGADANILQQRATRYTY